MRKVFRIPIIWAQQEFSKLKYLIAVVVRRRPERNVCPELHFSIFEMVEMEVIPLSIETLQLLHE